MAGRRPKRKVDFFPHYAKHGRTMFILEERYGNDGYAFWFKLLEILGDSDGHYFRAGNAADMAYLASKCRVDVKTGTEILDLLAMLGAIDPELWAAKVIWSQNFVDGLAVVYAKRESEIPRRPDPECISGEEIPFPVSEIHRVEESRVEVGEEGEEGEKTESASANSDAREVVTTRWPAESLEAVTLLTFQQATPTFSDTRGNLDAIPKLITLARARGDPCNVLPAMIELYQRLRTGEIPNMRDHAFWKDQPFTPKGMLSLWERLEPKAEAFIGNAQQEQRVNSFLTDEEEDDGDFG